ncbi:uncharacterized protein LOC136031877 [Artemia franciscana]|uniref:uncharacterized protein LOC136031877 n=1 Tax=Artemia franciscana TaxID=6661 RepID=UPI0032DB022F
MNRQSIILTLIYTFFYGGIGCIFPFISIHLRKVGLSDNEIGILTSLTSLSSFLALPLLVLGTQSKLGLRATIAVVCIFNFFLCFLLVVAPKYKLFLDPSQPSRFACSENGSVIIQQKCSEACYQNDIPRQIILHSCKLPESNSFPEQGIGIEDIEAVKNFSASDNITQNESDFPSSGFSEDKTENPICPDILDEDMMTDLSTDEIRTFCENKTSRKLHHICLTNSTGSSQCHVLTENMNTLTIEVLFTNSETRANECFYPLKSLSHLEENFVNAFCRLPPKGLLTCDIKDPDMCIHSIGNKEVTFWYSLCILSMLEVMVLIGVISLGMFSSKKMEKGSMKDPRKRLTRASFNSEDSIVIKPLGVKESSSTGMFLQNTACLFAGIIGFTAFSGLSGIMASTTSHSSYLLVPAVLWGVVAFLAGIFPEGKERILRRNHEPLIDTISFTSIIGILNCKRIIGLIFTEVTLGLMFGISTTILQWRLNKAEISCITLTAICVIFGVLALSTGALIPSINKNIGYWNFFLISLCFYSIRFFGNIIWTSNISFVALEAANVIPGFLAWNVGLKEAEWTATKQLNSAFAVCIISHFSVGRSLGNLAGSFGGLYIGAEATLLLSGCICLCIVKVWLFIEYGALGFKRRH